MMTDPPVLVLLPGMDGTGDLFTPFLHALRGRFETIVVRYPHQQALGYEELLPIARTAIPAERRFVIVAESFSGPIGIRLAAEAAPGLLGLVLCGSFARSPLPAFSRFGRWLRVVPMKSAVIGIGVLAMAGTRIDPPVRTLMKRTIAQIPPPVLRARLQAVLRVDVSQELASVDAPVLYLQATRDRAVPPTAADLVKRIKPDTDVVRIDGPHFLLQVSPDAAAMDIIRFASAVSKASPRHP